ncbi:MAG: CPBP family intramembrane metalloprotease [Chloroflexi bacterium]|nr:MAG: CPBP family intramembrane metalloprotease [Chloroflexota bacterium]MBL1196334.1 CPBP family intramembrane metalloprotease [Chloroflexota bacterium]NOH13629.1 CPBP family intramembrane metalloprotease [Chloroflexota bacterium]
MNNSNSHPARWRNIIIFVIAVYVISWVGMLLLDSSETGPGQLAFILAPILVTVALRTFAKDGWKDMGLGLRLRQAWRWYLFSALFYIVLGVLAVIVGLSTGMMSLDFELLPTLPGIMLVSLVFALIFSIFEEFAWRGYLEPRLENLGVPALRAHLITGIIWATWHYPLIILSDYTSESLVTFIPRFTLDVILAALVYGYIRRRSKSVWPAVLMHTMGNTVLRTVLLTGFFNIPERFEAYITPAAGGLLSIVFTAAVAFWLFRRESPTLVSEPSQA